MRTLTLPDSAPYRAGRPAQRWRPSASSSGAARTARSGCRSIRRASSTCSSSSAPAGIFARALNFEPPPTINNIPFQQAPLPPGAVLGVGGCQILVELDRGRAGHGRRPEEEDEPDHVRRDARSSCRSALYTILVDDAPEGGPRPSPKQAPELWQAPVASCPYTGGQALAFAREKMAVADAKRERRPFHVQDGVQAVPTYEAAAVCFRAGGDTASGTLAEESAKFLRRDITDDFRTRRVRLDHALAIEDYVSAQKEVRVLLQFMRGQVGRLRHMALEPRTKAEAEGRLDEKVVAASLACALLRARARLGASCDPGREGAGRHGDASQREATTDKLVDRGKAFAAMGDHTRAEEYLAAALDAGRRPARRSCRCSSTCASRPAATARPSSTPRITCASTPTTCARASWSARSTPRSARRRTRKSNLETVVSARPDDAKAHYTLGRPRP